MRKYLAIIAIVVIGSQAIAADVDNPQTNASALTTGTLPAARMPALTGDVTMTVGTTATTLAAGSASNLNSGTVAAARGGAGTINGVLAGNGAGAVSQGATTGLSDVSTGAVTPTDNSGAALSFTSVSAKYDKIGDVIFVFISFVYPSTVSGASTSISLGGLPANFPAAGYGRQCAITFSNGTVPAAFALPTASSAVVAFFTAAGAAVTNANLSLSNMILTCTYPAT